MFLPTLKEEVEKLSWKKLDVILITGDAYIDSSFIGVSVIGKLLLSKGYKVGIIGQPDINSDKDITRLGEPELFWGVTGGAIDSCVANFTALCKPRKKDDLTPGEINNKRPSRAVIVYANLIKKYFKNTVPIILGGLEASLRRIAHYDFLENNIRRSILFDAKADFLVYGMGEKTVLNIAEKLLNFKKNGGCLKEKEKVLNILKDEKGVCYISKAKIKNAVELFSYEEVKKDKDKFIKMFNDFYKFNLTGDKIIIQKQDTRYLVQNPRQDDLTEKELDTIYNLPYERDAHPYYKKMGKIKALDTIRFSITSHRGCFGECNFCSITVHQGKKVISRSEESIIKEAEQISKLPDFKGYILDVGGPTANMYGMDCASNFKCRKRCLINNCKNANFSHKKLIDLLKKLRNLKNIKKVFTGSGIRYDLVIKDEKYGYNYLKELSDYHISGQLKIAPEHINKNILKLMAKSGIEYFEKFVYEFYKINKDKKQFLTYYIIAAHPGCSEKEMVELKNYFLKNLKILPEQVQIFTPTPCTYSTLMYYTEKDPFTYKEIFVEKGNKGKQKQKEIITGEKNDREKWD